MKFERLQVSKFTAKPIQSAPNAGGIRQQQVTISSKQKTAEAFEIHLEALN
jgi:hypothetical protein